jgi:hypothetical protein
MAVAFAEMHGYPKSRWEHGEFTSERLLMCYWADRVDVLFWLDANFFYPYADGPQEALIRGVHIEPFGVSTASEGSSYAAYEWCLLRVIHSTKGSKWNAYNMVRMEETIYPSASLLSVPLDNLRWASDEEPLPEGMRLGYDEHRMDYVVKFERLKMLPSWILTWPGTVNANLLISPTYGLYFQPGVVKYMGAVCRRVQNFSPYGGIGSVPTFDVTAMFQIKPSGWNKYWRADTMTWDDIETTDGTPYIQYPTINMNFIAVSP